LPHYDMDLDALRTYAPVVREPEDFDAFWRTTLAESRELASPPEFARVDVGLRTVTTYDVTFSGFGGQPIKGWLLIPAGHDEPLPCVVEYIGYHGGRGSPIDWLLWSGVGYAHFIMDSRGQGSAWRRGDTPDASLETAPPQGPGYLTRGILSPDTYYYRRLIADAALALDAITQNRAIDSSRIAVTGASQGGGIALAAAALSSIPNLLMSDVPFLTFIERSVTLVETEPYAELIRYLAVHRDHTETVFRTLSYIDGANMAPRASIPALFSCALMDDICPPSAIFAAYNRYGGPKEIRVWPFNHHEGGEADQSAQRIAWLTSHWPVRSGQ
jgi:cephalosporin-C deacetylase